MQFEFASAARIIFGDGSAGQLPQLARDTGGRALLITDSFQPESVERLIDALRDDNLPITHYSVSGEPTVDVIDEAKGIASAAGCDHVISIGGGSVIDTGKASAALIPNEGDLLNYLEVIGAGRRLLADPLPFIALPTTAGTGAEVSKNAVLGSKAHRVKVSLRDKRMLANIALVGPQFTPSLPPAVTASTGMDALTQVLEPFVSHLANPLTDGMCAEGLRRAGRSLRTVYHEPGHADARRDMALTSLLGGLALANAKLGAVHGFAGVLGGMYNAPHGAICAALLPPVIDANIKALNAREPHNPALKRYEYAAQFLLDGRVSAGQCLRDPAPPFDRRATTNDALDWISETSGMFGIPGLGAYGLREDDFDEIVEKSSASSSMKGNPIVLNAEELKAILKAAL